MFHKASAVSVTRNVILGARRCIHAGGNVAATMGIPSEIFLPTNKPDIRPKSVGGEKGGSNSTPAV